MVKYNIDEAIASRSAIPKDVKRVMQDKLDDIDSGIRVESVQLTRSEPPVPTREAFEASIRASQTSQKAITDARTYATNTLNEAAGPLAEELHAAIMSETISREQEEALWEDVSGTARERLADALAYQAEVVETAKANADYLHRLLPEYRERPKLVIQDLYLDAIKRIYENADEKFVVQSTVGAKEGEVRVMLNKDQSLRPRKRESQGRSTAGD
jgi:membrane protease subunit HflK